MAEIKVEDLQALMNIRTMLIQDHERILDGPNAPASLCKQSDVAESFSNVIRALEEVIANGSQGKIKFERAER